MNKEFKGLLEDVRELCQRLWKEWPFTLSMQDYQLVWLKEGSKLELAKATRRLMQTGYIKLIWQEKELWKYIRNIYKLNN